MSNSSTTTGSSSVVHSTDGSSVTSESYTTTSYSTTDPPSQLNVHNSNQSTISAISDPSAATSSSSHFLTHNASGMAVFSPVPEETSSALEEASSSFAHSEAGPTTETNAKASSDPEGGAPKSKPPLSSGAPSLPIECEKRTMLRRKDPRLLRLWID